MESSLFSPMNPPHPDLYLRAVGQVIDKILGLGLQLLYIQGLVGVPGKLSVWAPGSSGFLVPV